MNPKIRSLLNSNTATNNFIALQLLQNTQNLSLEEALKSIIEYHFDRLSQDQDYFDLGFGTVCLNYGIDNYSGISNNPERKSTVYLERGVFDAAQNIEENTDDVDYVRIYEDQGYYYFKNDYSLVNDYKEQIIKDIDKAVILLAKLLAKKI